MIPRILLISQGPRISSILKRNISTREETTYLKQTYENGIRELTMRDQKTRNALSITMMENLIEGITKNRTNEDLRVIILSAEGKVFSAGHNLKELSEEFGKSQQEKVFQLASKLMCSIIDSPVPVIAKVNGVAAAAGCQLVAQCDMAICTDTSVFSTPGATFGIFCSTPGVALSRAIPKMMSLKMLLTGLPISSKEAKECGLVTEVCPKEKLDDIVMSYCDAIKKKSRSVIELGKRFYYKQINLETKQAYEAGGSIMVANLQLKDGQEGIRSFIEKRNAIWTHKFD